MLTDQELQSLRNLGNEAEAAADEIERLRDTLAKVHDWAAFAADMGDVLGQRVQKACAEALGPNVGNEARERQ